VHGCLPWNLLGIVGVVIFCAGVCEYQLGTSILTEAFASSNQILELSYRDKRAVKGDWVRRDSALELEVHNSAHFRRFVNALKRLLLWHYKQ